MIVKGWIPEGLGSLGVIACIPAPPPHSGRYVVWNDEQVGDRRWLPAGCQRVLLPLHAAEFKRDRWRRPGNGFASSGTFTSSNAKDFSFSGQGIDSALIAGNYSAKANLSGSISSALGTVGFGLVYQPIYEQAANLAAATGTYSGTASTSLGTQSVVLSLSSSGAITGNASGCLFTGLAETAWQRQCL